jgi:hypothetical protein
MISSGSDTITDFENGADLLGVIDADNNAIGFEDLDFLDNRIITHRSFR